MSSYLPNGEISAKEYNEKYNRERENAYCFLHNLEHNIQKGGAYEETMRQLSIAGWPETRETLLAALSIYHEVLKGKLEGGHPSSKFRHVILCKECDFFHEKVDGSIGFCKCGEVCGGQPMGRVAWDFCSYGLPKGSLIPPQTKKEE